MRMQAAEAELQPRISFLNSPGAPRALTTTINTYIHVICAGALHVLGLSHVCCDKVRKTSALQCHIVV